MKFQQLDMDNFEQPLATATVLEGLSVTPGFYIEKVIALSPNKFKENND